MPLNIDLIRYFLCPNIFFLVRNEKIKKPIATIKNLNASAEKGSLLSIIGFVVIKAEDQSKIKIKGNSFIIKKKNTYF